MISRHLKTPSAMMRLGLVFMILAQISNYLLRRSGLLSENLVDLISGFFFGLTIATLMLSVVMRRNNTPRRS
jgi:hypothetical protein